MSEPTPSRRTLKMLFAPLAVKPWLGAVFIGFLFAGVAIGWVAFPPQWDASLKIGFGLLLGFGSTMSLFLPRMIATDYDD